jgi:hypothetical protein
MDGDTRNTRRHETPVHFRFHLFNSGWNQIMIRPDLIACLHFLLMFTYFFVRLSTLQSTPPPTTGLSQLRIQAPLDFIIAYTLRCVHLYHLQTLTFLFCRLSALPSKHLLQRLFRVNTRGLPLCRHILNSPYLGARAVESLNIKMLLRTLAGKRN